MTRKTVQERKVNALKYILLAVVIGAIFMVVTKWVLPMVFGVSFAGLLSTVRSKLSAVGGVLGGAMGYVVEGFANFSNYIIAPLLNLNPFAIVGFVGVISLASVIVINIYTYREVWR